MTHAPDLVHGAWYRRSCAIDHGPHFETQHVVWLQAGTCYADVRVPFHPAAAERCFTGRSGWDGDAYRWSHQVDLDPVGGDDVGELSWEDDALIERGEFPVGAGSVSYEEVWCRLPCADGPFFAAETPSGCVIRVGDHAITVMDDRAGGGTFAACYRVLDHERWRVQLAIGEPAALPDPRNVPRSWTVVHHSTAMVHA